MSMNDSETVSLIGGGHAFGKAHGACPSGPGPSPKTQPSDPWPGTCGSGPDKGKGPNTFTSGFELQWTPTPSSWSNYFFTALATKEFELVKSPAGAPQWRIKGDAKDSKIAYLTTDVALTKVSGSEHT